MNQTSNSIVHRRPNWTSPPLSQKLQYQFDNLMSKGTVAMIGLLGLLSLFIITIAGSILSLFQITQDEGEPLSFMEGVWESLMRTLDSGTMGGDTGWGFRLIAFAVTLGGIFIISTLIGVLSSGIEGRLEELRKGKSFVIEKNHTLILGWSSKIFTLISELVIANENQTAPRIVILADKDKVEMEDEIREKIPNLKNTKVICRSGNPNDLDDLEIVNPHQSKSIIILAHDEENSDPHTIKTILAITNNPTRRDEPYHIVAEIKDRKNLDAAQMIGKEEVELLLTDDIISRIMVQTSRQSGLSNVYTEFMDFDGAEIYFTDEPKLYGKTYGDALFKYENSSLIGLQFSNGNVSINPDMNYTIAPGDKVIAVSEDDDTLVISDNDNYSIDSEVIVNSKPVKAKPERILLLGWNKRGSQIIRQMGEYVAKSSYMKIVSTYPDAETEVISLKKELKNIKLEFDCADTTMRETIDALDITSYDSVQLLCYEENLDLQEADAQTLITLLHLRRVCEEMGKNTKIVSEMLDLRNRELAQVTRADDFIVSDKLVSLLISQVSENKFLMKVFDDLFTSEGSEIYLKPIEDYIELDKEVNFYTLIESARQKGHSAIGYRIIANAFDKDMGYGVKINPTKSEKIKFSAGDKIIVLAEE